MACGGKYEYHVLEKGRCKYYVAEIRNQLKEKKNEGFS